MIKPMNVLFACAFGALVAFVATDSSAQVYLESDGQVVVEVEATAATGNWLVSQTIPGYTGTSYYKWNGATTTQGGNSLLTYQIQIQNPGNYQILWRSRIEEATDRTEANDTFVSLSGTPIAGQQTINTNAFTKAYTNQLNAWSWQTATVDNNPQPIRQFFSAGQHTIRISGRSFGHAVDRFVLFKYEEKPYESNSSSANATQANALTALPQSGLAGPADPEVLCFAAGESPVLSGNMTTSSLFGVGDDLDADEDALTIPLLFANSSTNADTATTTDTATYTVNLPASGTWYAWGRFYYPDAPNVNGANSFALRINGGARLRFGNNGSFMREWHYGGDGAVESGTPGPLPLGTLAAGNNTIAIEKREVVSTPPRLDVICLVNQVTLAPLDSDVCDLLGGCGATTTSTSTTTTTTLPPEDIACIPAAAPLSTTGVMTTSSDFTGGSDLDPTLDSLMSQLLFVNSATNPGTDSATFNIEIPSSGTWFLWGRFYYPGTPGSNDANSFQARLGTTGAFRTFGNKLDRFRQWHFDGGGTETGAVTGLSLGAQTPGNKTLVIRKREVVPIPPRLDVLCVTKNGTTPPSDEEACAALGGC